MNTRHLFIFTIAACTAGLTVARGQTNFTQITNGAIVTDMGGFAAPTWADFGNRGLLDVLVASPVGNNVFYQNNGDGTFTKVTSGTLVQYVPDETGAPVADYDNDGFLDVAVIAGSGGPSLEYNLLYHNNGNGTFAAVADPGFSSVAGYFNVGAWADYDNDGFVDFYSGQADPNNVGRNSALFHNNGDGTFRSVTNTLVSDAIAPTSVAWADYDNDGFMDLIAGSGGPGALNHNFLYHNNRDGTFTRNLTNVVATDAWPDGAWTPTWGDYDNDGLPDLFVAGVQAGNALYHNDGHGAFTKIMSGPMLSAPTGGGFRACGWGDYDNDGYLDLFAVSYNAPNRLFHNNGDGTFTMVTNSVFDKEANNAVYGQTCSWVDYDGDGFLDLFVTRFPENGVTNNLLYHNNGNTNAWLEVKLVGTVANRAAIGAKVRVHATIGGKSVWQMREISTGGGRWVQPLIAHFGLGNATNVDSIRIEWPSGTVQQITNIAVRKILTITEPARLLATVTNGVPRFSLNGGRNLTYGIDSSTDLRSWTPLATMTITNQTGVASIIDTNPPLAPRFYRAVSR